MFTFEYICVIFTAIYLKHVVPLECYSCSKISHISTCETTASCPSGQSCYVDFSDTAGYTLGCIENTRCGALSHVSASIVGRNLLAKNLIHQTINEVNDLSKRDLAEREAQHCFECCSVDICNRHLCGHLKPTACIDDPKVDCAWLNSKFSICQMIHEAKSVCPKFCTLCSLVDGNWADWSSWSACDVTCENGTQIRTRQCSNPTPINGGLNCSGSDIEHKICIRQTCPIDGNWTAWSPWSSCVVSCENGTQTKTRACSYPAPAFGGRNCSGTFVEYKQCFINDYCPIHGGWTQWLPWEACSVTCDIGIQRRHRDCSNPFPQHSGHYCLGDTMDVALCLPGPCANGGWSTWDSWSSCSVTCGAGIKSRSRTCSNPQPSALGNVCKGDENQYVSCNIDMCLTPTVAFHARFLTSTILSIDGTFVFTDVILNAGNGYSNSTGIFTAPLSETYFFSAQICIDTSPSDYLRFQIVRNGIAMTSTLIMGNNVRAECESAAVTFELGKNDRVWVKHTNQNGNLYQYEDALNMFTGSLQHL